MDGQTNRAMNGQMNGAKEVQTGKPIESRPTFRWIDGRTDRNTHSNDLN